MNTQKENADARLLWTADIKEAINEIKTVVRDLGVSINNRVDKLEIKIDDVSRQINIIIMEAKVQSKEIQLRLECLERSDDNMINAINDVKEKTDAKIDKIEKKINPIERARNAGVIISVIGGIIAVVGGTMGIMAALGKMIKP